MVPCKHQFIVFIDEYFRFIIVYFICHKSNVIDKFQAYLRLLWKIMKLTRKSKCFDLMMVANLLPKILIYFIIAWEFINSYLQQQNGFFEPKNIILMESIKNMLKLNKLPKSFKGEVIVITF
jgi:hypothetical protein